MPPDAPEALTPEAVPASAAEAVGAVADPWSGLEASLRPLVEAKAWKNGSDAVRGYAAAEKLLSKPADELAWVPKAGLTPEMKRELAARVFGTPEKPEAYDFGEIKDEEGGPPMLEWFRGVAHELGLGVPEAKAVAEKWQKFGQEQLQASEAQAAQRRETAAAQLRGKFGPEFDAKRALGARALSALGITEEGAAESSELELMLENAMGPERFFEVFAGLGEKLGEHKLVEGLGNAPAGAGQLQAEHAALMASEAMHNKAHPGHAAAAARALEIMTKLHGEQPAYGPGSE